MSELVEQLLMDLRAERRDLVALLKGRSASDWTIPTPAPRWTVQDQVAHLAHFDAITSLSIGCPEDFIRLRNGVPDLQAYIDEVGPGNYHRVPDQMLHWWEEAANALEAAALKVDSSVRVPWFGPSMSLPSKLTARIMETWAHGQDIYDTFEVFRTPSQRLRHVARIAVLAFPNSFQSRGLSVPEASVHVELQSPDGDIWSWGEPEAANAVRGPLEDFCLVATQRRHRADTRLEIVGDVANVWMEIAQAFAGPPGLGRKPGKFSPPTPVQGFANLDQG